MIYSSELRQQMFLEIVRDIIQIVFYATATTVAWIGLRKWREELKGKVEYEAAKQALAKAYIVRDEIRIIQSEMMHSSEWAEREPAEHETEKERKTNQSFFAYSKRLQKLQDKISDLYPAMVEVEAVFGDEARGKLDKLITVTRTLRAAIQMYHQGLYESWQNPKGPNSRYLNIIYGINEFENPGLKLEKKVLDDDNFKRDLDAAMQEIKEYFIPKLARKLPSL